MDNNPFAEFSESSREQTQRNRRFDRQRWQYYQGALIFMPLIIAAAAGGGSLGGWLLGADRDSIQMHAVLVVFFGFCWSGVMYVGFLRRMANAALKKKHDTGASFYYTAIVVALLSSLLGTASVKRAVSNPSQAVAACGLGCAFVTTLLAALWSGKIAREAKRRSSAPVVQAEDAGDGEFPV